MNRRAIAHGVVTIVWVLSAARVARAELPKPRPSDPQFNNPWPAEWEQEYRRRAEHVLSLWEGQKPRGGTFGENEKNYYPTAMMAILTGDRAAGLKALQEPDHEKKDHAWTNGVDFYWCFTLKGQVRKYFYFGDMLDPAYRANFKEGARKWVEQDPKATRHPVYDGALTARGWGPAAKGYRVDRRNTDNLRAMSDTSIYLMAEEVGNAERAAQYRKRIEQYVQTLYNVGMSEWDSPNYHAHSLSTYHNLYDFAKDPEVKLLAKAALDWLYAAAAVKYYRGGWGAPNARDYGGNRVFLPGAVHQPWLYFGDTPQMDDTRERDVVYHLTSAYRPPAAVVELARKRFKRPVEMFATKPHYRDWSPGQESAPAFWETQYFGHTFQMGSAVATDTGGPWNINCFKLLALNSQRGVDYFVANTESILGDSFKRPGDQVGQRGNVVVWLRPSKPEKPFFFQLPRAANRELIEGTTFVQLEKTWLALYPINLGELAEVDLRELVNDSKNPADAIRQYEGEVFLRAVTRGDTYSGFALQVGEETSASFEDFKRSAGQTIDAEALGRKTLTGPKGTIAFDSFTGAAIRMGHNSENELPRVAHPMEPGFDLDWSKVRDVYGPGRMGKTPILQKRLSGELRVEAGGHVFEGKLSKDGKYTFVNQLGRPWSSDPLDR